MVAALIAVLWTAAAPAPAAAASWGCDASALRGTLAGATFEPVTANHGAAACAPATAGGATALAGLPVALTGGGLAAATGLQPASADAGQQVATATARVTDLRLVPLPGQIPAPPIPAGLASVSIPGATVDLTPAIAALVTPPAELLAVSSATSSATGRCTGGRPGLTATSATTGLRVLGRTVASGSLDQAIPVTGAQTISPAQLDPAKVTLPGGAPLPAALVGPLRTALAALPPIALPAQVGQLTVRPGEETRTAGRLTRRALHVTVALGGVTLLDAVLGETSVAADGVACGGAAQVAAEQALQCTKRRLVLVDVLGAAAACSSWASPTAGSSAAPSICASWRSGRRAVGAAWRGRGSGATACSARPPRSRRGSSGDPTARATRRCSDASGRCV